MDFDQNGCGHGPSARRLHTKSPVHSLFCLHPAQPAGLAVALQNLAEPGGRAHPRPFKGQVVRLPHEAANSKLTSFKTVVTLGHANGVALQTVHGTSQCQQSKQNLQLPPTTPRTLRLSRRERSHSGGRCKSIGHYDNEPIHGLGRRKCFCIPRCRWSTNSWRPRKSCRSTCRIPTSSVSIRSPAQCSSSHRQSHRRQHRIEATPCRPGSHSLVGLWALGVTWSLPPSRSRSLEALASPSCTREACQEVGFHFALVRLGGRLVHVHHLVPPGLLLHAAGRQRKQRCKQRETHPDDDQGHDGRLAD